jgi:hypothetical protein
MTALCPSSPNVAWQPLRTILASTATFRRVWGIQLVSKGWFFTMPSRSPHKGRYHASSISGHHSLVIQYHLWGIGQFTPRSGCGADCPSLMTSWSPHKGRYHSSALPSHYLLAILYHFGGICQFTPPSAFRAWNGLLKPDHNKKCNLHLQFIKIWSVRITFIICFIYLILLNKPLSEHPQFPDGKGCGAMSGTLLKFFRKIKKGSRPIGPGFTSNVTS